MENNRSGILTKGELISDTYEIQSLIGEGAFGEVYKVKHKYLGVQVLKVFREEYINNTDIETVTKEARILSKLTHPNIVRVFEANTFMKSGQTYYFITMGFVSGETLAQLLKRKIQLPVPVALSIQNDFLMGLNKAHEQKASIVHRDISPDNILLSYEGERPVAMLSDFGLAQSFNQISSISAAAGKYSFMAPECFWGSYLLTSDVFSSGVVLYRMLTGIMPWEYDFENAGDDPNNIMTMIVVARRIPPNKPSLYCDGCHGGLDEVILQSLSIDLENRYKTAGEFIEALQNSQIKSRTSKHAEGEKSSIDKEIVRPHKTSLPGKGFDEIAGMKELKDILYQDIILPLNEKELYEEYKISIPNGILLYGPPGCGKTYIAQKFADEVSYNFIEIKPSDLASTYIHGTQKKIGELFKNAEDNAPSIIFIDEIDALIPTRRENLNHGYSSEVNEFLAQMTECHKRGIFVVAATNRPEIVDPALLRTGRIDKVIYVGMPDYNARVEMFKMYLANRPVSENIDYSKVATISENYTASDINYIVNEAARIALKLRTKIKQEHLEEVINKTPPSISDKQIKNYDKFRNSRIFC